METLTLHSTTHQADAFRVSLINIYDKTWYAGLSAWDKVLLKPKGVLHMPIVVTYD